MLTLYRAPWSTNVERVALALAHKGLEVESVWIDYADRAPVVAVSGQPLVPVLVFEDGHAAADSMRIIAELDRRHPHRPLFPADAARRAEMEFFIRWFDESWKIAPNEITRLLSEPDPDDAAVAALASQMQERLALFFSLLSDGRSYLFGDDFSAADCCAFPFLKYARGREADDEDLFHVVLDRYMTVRDGPLLEWIERVDAMPRV